MKKLLVIVSSITLGCYKGEPVQVQCATCSLVVEDNVRARIVWSDEVCGRWLDSVKMQDRTEQLNCESGLWEVWYYKCETK